MAERGERKVTTELRIPGPRRVAFVTARYPPMTSCGTFRVEAVRRFLPEFGYQPTFITLPAPWVRQQADGAVASHIDEEDPTVLRPRVRSDPLVRGLARVPVLRRAQRWILLPDLLVPWARGVPRRAAAVVQGVDVVMATGPPFSSLIAGHRLARLLGVPAVLEIRDPPTGDRRARRRGGYALRRLQTFERKYLQEADAVIAVTPGMRERLIQSHDGLADERVHVVTNGYPDSPVDLGLSGRTPDTFTVSYVGSLRSSRDLATLAELARVMVTLDDPAELRLVGPGADQVRGLSAQNGDGCITVLGKVPRGEALAELATTDVSLVLADESENWWIGRKVFESLALADRILAVVPPGDTAALLGGSGKSVVIPPGDAQGIARAVHAVHDQWRRGLSPQGPEPAILTDRQSVAGIAAVLDSVLADSGVRPGRRMARPRRA